MPAAIGLQENLGVLLVAAIWVHHLAAAIDAIIDLHDTLVAFLAGHELCDHGAILLVNSGLISIAAVIADHG